jgi:hypothetical protein
VTFHVTHAFAEFDNVEDFARMKLKALLSTFAFGLLSATHAYAEVGIAGNAGTSGIGAHVSFPLQPNLNARFGLNYLDYTYSGSTSNVNYDVKLKLQTFDALLDYFPLDNPFRISAGVIYNGNNVRAVGKPSAAGTYTLNGTTYTTAVAGTVNGNVDFKKFAPYLGIGWGNPLKAAGWGFVADLGVMFQGSPSTTLTSSGCAAPQATCDALVRDLAAENNALADKANNFRAYPIVRIGASYRF